ncbi:MAG: lysylphosphatidylglycerol synthase transmembrane domain-containing protein [Kofleriaceae bacterium]
MNPPRRRHVLHAVALVVGFVALAFLLDRLGWEAVEDTVLGTGGWFLVIAAIDLASVFCDAGGVYTFVQPLARISYFRVFAAQASGLAINRLTPGNSLGEPIKITMLMQHVPEAPAVSAIVMFNVASYILAIAVIVIGVPVTLLALDLPQRVDLVVMIVTVALLAFAVGVLALVRRGAAAALLATCARIRLLSRERAARWTRRLAAVDTNLRRFGDRTTRRALVFVVGSRICNMAGTVVILHAAQIPLTVPLVVGMLSVGILITWISNVVPLGLGLADGGNYILYSALGSSPEHGLAFAMINRLRTVMLASMGLAVMALANLFDRRASE